MPATHQDQILSREEVKHLADVGVEECLSKLGVLVIHQRRLPDYYLRRECQRQGATHDSVKKWTPTRWVTNAGRVTIENRAVRRIALMTLQAIHQRISHHPPEETYVNARFRLQKRVNELLDQGVRRSRISDLMRVNPKTIRTTLEYTHGQANSNAHCPWDLLDRIDAIDWEPHRNATIPDDSPRLPMTEREIQSRRHTDRQSEQSALTPLRHYVCPGDTCWNCGAAWANLQPELPEFPGKPIETYVCRLCSRISYLEEPIHVS